MAQKPYAALGVVQTPHGEVIVRKVWKVRQSTFVFQLKGNHLSLRWMVPGWKPANPSTRTQITPPRPLVDPDDLKVFFNKMAAAWERKMALGGYSPQYSNASTLAPYSTLGQLREIVKAEMAASLRPSTVTTYKHQWNGVFAYIPAETPVLSIDRIMIQNTVSKMSETALSAATVRKNIEALNRLLIRAVEDGMLASSPVKRVRLPKKPKRIPRFLSAPQREDLLRVAQAHGKDAHLLVALGVYLGLRKAELLSLRWDQIDLTQRVAHVVNQKTFTTKNGKNRAIPICDELHSILLPYSNAIGFVLQPGKTYEKGSRYRWEFRGLLKVLVKNAGLGSWVTAHIMRHTFASLYAQAGVSLYKIGTWMGHSSSEVTEIYAHLAAYDSDINKGSIPISVGVRRQ
jgi:site-specific recombinase XerD